MHTRLTLKPGKPGTKKQVAEYGDRLVCVRYRYDEERHLRLKTVEIIVEVRDWSPREAAPDPLEYVHITFPRSDATILRGVKRLGGLWDSSVHAWRITRGAVAILGMTERIVTSASTDIDIENTHPRIDAKHIDGGRKHAPADTGRSAVHGCRGGRDGAK